MRTMTWGTPRSCARAWTARRRACKCASNVLRVDAVRNRKSPRHRSREMRWRRCVLFRSAWRMLSLATGTEGSAQRYGGDTHALQAFCSGDDLPGVEKTPVKHALSCAGGSVHSCLATCCVRRVAWAQVHGQALTGEGCHWQELTPDRESDWHLMDHCEVASQGRDCLGGRGDAGLQRDSERACQRGVHACTE